jgi:hypothetical protein
MTQMQIAALYDELCAPKIRRVCCAKGLGEMAFIVQGKPRTPQGALRVTKETRLEAMQAATDLLAQGMAFVTIVAEGRVYTVEEFALTFLDSRD